MRWRKAGPITSLLQSSTGPRRSSVHWAKCWEQVVQPEPLSRYISKNAKKLKKNWACSHRTFQICNNDGFSWSYFIFHWINLWGLVIIPYSVFWFCLFSFWWNSLGSFIVDYKVACDQRWRRCIFRRMRRFQISLTRENSQMVAFFPQFDSELAFSKSTIASSFDWAQLSITFFFCSNNSEW